MLTDYIIITLLSIIVAYEFFLKASLKKRVEALETLIMYNLLYMQRNYKDYGKPGAIGELQTK